MAQPAPTDNWRGAMASAKAEGPNGRATSQPRNQERKPASKAVANRTASRSSSQPKQRGKGNAGKPPPTPSALSVHEARLVKKRLECEEKAPEELEMQLQVLLQRGDYWDAAYLIEASEYLVSKYKTADVVRLMLEAKQFERATQLIREMSMASNQVLVTLLVKDLVLAAQFHAAVRVAQEMVQDFGKSPADGTGSEQGRVGWTPLALVQAMIRAQHFRTALKFAKQFNLLDTFPVVPLVASMFETRCWADGVSCVMEYRLFTEFPLNVLTVRMLEQRQWTLAIKCMNKLESKDELVKFQQALVQEAARVGDFVTSIMYLREFKLDQPDTNLPLLRFVVDSMVGHGEFYKAIKYAIKFELAGDGEGQVVDDLQSQYGTKALIMRAIQTGQYHVATTYIKKLKLQDEFAKELVEIERLQQAQLAEFRQYLQLRVAQYEDPAYQMQLHRLIGEKAVADAEMIVLDPVEVDVLISETEEVFPRKKKPATSTNEETSMVDNVASHGAAVEHASTPEPDIKEAVNDLKLSESPPQRQSRFKFALAVDEGSVIVPPANPIQPQTMAAPLASSPLRSTSSPSPPASSPQPPGFNFADFASSVLQMPPRGAQPPGLQPPGHQPPGLQPSSFQPSGLQPPGFQPVASTQATNIHQSGVQSQPHIRTMQSAPQPPLPSQGFGPVIQHPQGGIPMHTAYNNLSMRGHLQPPVGAMGYPRGPAMPAMPSGAGFTPSFQPPLPPPPPYSMGSTNPSMGSSSSDSATSVGGGGFDIASLAMQFHNSSGSTSGFSNSGFGSSNAPPPPPPMGYATNPMRPYQPAGGYPGALQHPAAFGFAPPPPPTSTFKPSIGYTTSVITTRQKK